MPKDATEEVVPGDTTLMRKEPMRHSIATHKYEQTERSAITAITPEEGRSGGHS